LASGGCARPWRCRRGIAPPPPRPHAGCHGMHRFAGFTKARLPRRTVRLRLTLLCGSRFVVSGAALLGITYLLMRHASGEVVQVTGTELAPPRGGGGPAVAPSLEPLQVQAQRLLVQADRQRA